MTAATPAIENSTARTESTQRGFAAAARSSTFCTHVTRRPYDAPVGPRIGPETDDGVILETDTPRPTAKRPRADDQEGS